MQPSQVQQLPANAALTDSSAVLVANQMNLSIFKPLWLRKEAILKEDEFSDNVLISPGVVQIPTTDFELTILPNRVQMRFRPPGSPEASAHLLRVMGGIVQVLPHTPYTAVGLNFHYLIGPPPEADFVDWSRRAFSAPCANSIVTQEDRDARFGSYLSFNEQGMRLRIDIKPIRGCPDIVGLRASFSEGQELMAAHFNYHADLQQPPKVEVITGTIQKWSCALKRSREIVKTIAA